MNRIEARFNQLKADGRKAIIPFVTAGDSQPSVTVPLMHALVEAGADVIELGVPFSDPMADGPVIQLACERSLMHGTRLLDVLDMVAEFRQQDTETPIVLMGYLNPVEAIGYENFAQRAKAAGVDGVLTVDLPPVESEGLMSAMKEQGLDIIFLIAPTTSPARRKAICEQGSGYLYYVSVKGVTGSSALNVDEVADYINDMRQDTDLPLCVGFGIRDGATAKAVCQVADGAIVGSVLVNRIAELANKPDEIPSAVAAIISEMRSAVDAA
ncbi:MAG TPA: tryptophan synthase subunit alpha [Marinobacterium sp.]|nr:tryptophan synthase subunit alpha [Marinobacterium sp.]